MSALLLSSIVEGHGEVQAVPILLRRLGQRLAPSLLLRLNSPLRVKRDRFLNNQAEFARHVDLAARKATSTGAVLILLDAHEACPAELGPQLLKRAREVRPDVRVAVVLARREFEAWFLAAASSLRNVAGLSSQIESPPRPEDISGAKEWLAQHLPHRKYIAPRHQPAFAERFDLDSALRVPSFDKFFREVSELFSSSAENVSR
jgi:hypothetical protein